MEQQQGAIKTAAAAAEPGYKPTATSQAWAAEMQQAQREHAAVIQEIQTMQAQLDSIEEVSAGASAVGKLRYILARRLAVLLPKQQIPAVPSSVRSSRTAQHNPRQTAQSAAAQFKKVLSRMQEKMAGLQQALDTERQAHAFTSACEAQAADELLSAQQRLASTSLALTASQQDLSSALAQMALMRHQQQAADKAEDRLTADAAVLRQQLHNSNTCLQQQRQATAAARSQAAAAVFAWATLEAQLRSARTACSRVQWQQQHSLQQELEQARLERDQARGDIQDLTVQLQQASSARIAAERTLAAERAQHCMAVVAGAAVQHAMQTAQAELDAARRQLQATAQELSGCRTAISSHRRAAANAAVIAAAVQEQLHDSSEELQQLQQVAAAALARAHAAERAAATAAAESEQVLQQLLAAEADISTLQTQLQCGFISQSRSAEQEAADCCVEVVPLPTGLDTYCRDGSPVGSKHAFGAASTKALTAAHPAAAGWRPAGWQWPRSQLGQQGAGSPQALGQQQHGV